MSLNRPRQRLYQSVSDPSNVEDDNFNLSSEELQRINSQDNLISTEDLREYFECPVCFVVPRKPPIYACVRGHMICASCKPRIAICPTCRVPFDGQPYRLYFAERLLEERVPIACSYADFGCKVEAPGAAIKRHEEAGCSFEPITCLQQENGCKMKVSRRLMTSHTEICEYRLIDCPLAPNCKEKVVKKRLLNHLEAIHLTKGFFGGRSTESYVHLLFIALIILCFLSFIINIFFFLYYLS